MIGGVIWNLADAWSAAVDVTAAAYGVPADLLKAPSRGRGPRPPEPARWPKKMAVHVAVIVADCDYAELGRLIGLHKDTVASHCASVRDDCAISDQVERISELLVQLALVRLSVAPPARRKAA